MICMQLEFVCPKAGVAITRGHISHRKIGRKGFGDRMRKLFKIRPNPITLHRQASANAQTESESRLKLRRDLRLVNVSEIEREFIHRLTNVVDGTMGVSLFEFKAELGVHHDLP